MDSLLILSHPDKNGRCTGRYWRREQAARAFGGGMLALWYGAPWWYGYGVRF